MQLDFQHALFIIQYMVSSDFALVDIDVTHVCFSQRQVFGT